jgi:hypothetical protein
MLDVLFFIRTNSGRTRLPVEQNPFEQNSEPLFVWWSPGPSAMQETMMLPSAKQWAVWGVAHLSRNSSDGSMTWGQCFDSVNIRQKLCTCILSVSLCVSLCLSVSISVYLCRSLLIKLISCIESAYVPCRLPVSSGQSWRRWSRSGCCPAPERWVGSSSCSACRSSLSKRSNLEAAAINVIKVVPWRRRLLVASPPATEETGAMGREIESRQGIRW